jgi:hypothetical protein
MAKGRGITISTHDFNPKTGQRPAFDHGGISCRPCERDLGQNRKAHRIMHKGGGRCEEHYRYEAGLPQRTPEAAEFIERWKQVVRELGAPIEVDSIPPEPEQIDLAADDEGDSAA